MKYFDTDLRRDILSNAGSSDSFDSPKVPLERRNLYLTSFSKVPMAKLVLYYATFIFAKNRCNFSLVHCENFHFVSEVHAHFLRFFGGKVKFWNFGSSFAGSSDSLALHSRSQLGENFH